MFIETPEHTKIFEEVKSKKNNIIVQAAAGGGKTTAAIKALDHIPKNEKIIFLAFNKSVHEALKERVPSHVETKTLNGLGNYLWRSYCRQNKLGGVKLNSYKIINIAKEYMVKDLLFTEKVATKWAWEVKKLVPLMKARGIRLDEDLHSHARDILDHHGVIYNTKVISEPELVDISCEVYKRSCEQFNIIDFDDQLLLPVLHNAVSREYDRVFIDEAQDLTPLQHELVGLMIKEDGQLFGIGDKNQSIYAFRGADKNSMDNMKKFFNAKELGLSVTYRCAKSIVKEANKVTGEICARDDAPDGLNDKTLYSIKDADIRPGDMVVCRLNAPAIDLCHKLMQVGIPAAMLGKDIGIGLVNQVKKTSGFSMASFILNLNSEKNKQVNSLVNRGATSVQIMAIEDKFDSIAALAKNCDKKSDLIDEIGKIFEDKGSEDKVTICTVHKAKGLEADRVWLLEPDLFDGARAKKKWEMEQELNIKYVAITRAKNELKRLTLKVD